MSNNSAVPSVDINSSSDSVIPDKHYIFTPAGLEVKVTLGILIAAAGVIGFLGNLTVLRFILREEKKRPRATTASNLNYFISSLALSDVLGAVICVPLLIINWSVDVFQTGWPCNIVRFFIFLFPAITIYNLVVVSLERYILICRATSRPLSRSLVQKLVKGAWILAVFVVLPVSYTVKGIRVELNETHYTVVCKLDSSFLYQAVISQSTLAALYIFPLAFISFTCGSVIRSVWKKKFHAGTADNNEAMRKWRYRQRKATWLLLAVIFAFVIPYFLIVAYTIYEFIAEPPTNFKRDFVLRSTGAFLTYLNGAVNLCIHLVQLPGFSLFSNPPRVQKYNIKTEPINEHEKKSTHVYPFIDRNTQNFEVRKIRRASVSGPINISNQHMAHTRRNSV